MSELSSEIRELVERAKALDGPNPERREHVKRALFAGISSAAALSTSAHAAAQVTGHTAVGAGVTKAIGSASLLTLFALGAAGGVAVAVPATVVSLRSTERAPATASVAPRSARLAAPDDEPAASRPPEAMKVAPAQRTASEDTSSEPPARAFAPKRTAAESPAGKGTEPALAVESSFSAEASVLQDAQRALSQGDTAVALERLSEHARRFPSGALAEEREAAFVLALCAAGRVDEARRHRAALARAAPSSPLLPRIERSCAKE
jgi:hypothetical protein